MMTATQRAKGMLGVDRQKREIGSHLRLCVRIHLLQ